MATEIRVPQMGESVTEGVIAQWLKNEGDSVAADEPIVEVETDKITVEVPAPSAGVLGKQSVAEGDTVAVGDVLGTIEGSGTTATAATVPAMPAVDKGGNAAAANQSGGAPAMPAAQAEARRSGVDLSTVSGTGRGGRVLKEDVQRAGQAPAAKAPAAKAPPPPPPPPRRAPRTDGPLEERKKMSPIRQRVAERLVQSQQGTATLTTFNEVDMSAVIELRKRYKEKFLDRHGVKLGFMSFFVKAAVDALKSFPAVNAEIDGTDVVYKNFYNIGVAVGGGKGLVVPVLRDADQMTFADVELSIGDFGYRAKNNKLVIDDLQGGTFTVSNGGVYGSMLSTPILNPPQTGILGLHNIVQRPVAIDGKVEIRPIMYVALSYDHRLIDGREAVQFLVRIKQLIEDPERLMLEV
ncbi:MAG: 2-oxoglutarate dehydrogenase complex dihydrolipoyllysine-residue succinyltransferase [Myxococcota bacterium]